jgi:parallel beta-helix repeat protein
MNGNTMIDNGDGIWLACSSRYNSIDGNLITNNSEGILLDSSSNNNISGNTVADNWEGILLSSSSSCNSIDRNTITNNGWYGIGLDSASSNSISGNTMAKNNCGILLGYSSGNAVCHNNFIDKTCPVNNLTPTYSSFWDNGCEGNYWSDCNGTDANYDGIGDTPYVIDANNTDHHPLMGMFYSFNVSWVDSGYFVDLISNSTISGFDVRVWIEHPEDPNIRIIDFNVTGPNYTFGFCRILIPTALMNGNYTVFVNGLEVASNLLPGSNSTHSYLYFNYAHSTQEVRIIPEFSSVLTPLLFFTVTLLTVIIYRRKRR